MAAFEAVNQHQLGLCDCMSKPQTTRAAMKDVATETGEMLQEVKSVITGPNRREAWDKVKDEGSDVAWGVGRALAGAKNLLTGTDMARGEPTAMVRVPGDQRHYDKVKGRYTLQGCGRSANQIRKGNGCVPPPAN
jgi:hypothetical protein